MQGIMKLAELLKVNKKAFTAILIGSIMAILIGAVLLIVTYVLLSPIVNAATAQINSTLVGCLTFMNSFGGTVTVIMQSLTIVGISLIVAGVAGIIYMLMGVAGMTQQRGR